MPIVDLRKGIAWALGQGVAATTAEVAALAGTEPGVALRELRRLKHLNVVDETADGGWRPGSGWVAWKKTPTTTAVGGGGNSKAYQAAKAVRDAIRQRAWVQGREAAAREQAAQAGASVTSDAGATPGAPAAAPAERSGRAHATLADRLALLRARGVAVEQLLTTAETCALLGVSRMTLWRYGAAGRLVPVRLSGSAKRYRASDVARLINQGNAS